MSDRQSPVQRSGGRASRNVLLTLLGAGVVGGAMWGLGGGTDCRSQRFPTREACEVTNGAGQCREESPGGPWLAANCPQHYTPRSGSHWWFIPGRSGGYSGAPPSGQARPGSTGRIDAPAPSSRSGTSGGSSRRGGFGSVGSSRSGSS